MKEMVGYQVIGGEFFTAYHLAGDLGNSRELGKISIHAPQSDIDAWRLAMCLKLEDLVGGTDGSYDWGRFYVRIPPPPSMTGPGGAQKAETTVQRALEMIAASACEDFGDSPLVWAEWCRAVAQQALEQEHAEIDRLLASLERSGRAQKEVAE